MALESLEKLLAEYRVCRPYSNGGLTNDEAREVMDALPDLLAAARALEKARAFVAGVDLHGGAAEPADQWRYSLLPAIDAALARLGAKGES